MLMCLSALSSVERIPRKGFSVTEILNVETLMSLALNHLEIILLHFICVRRNATVFTVSGNENAVMVSIPGKRECSFALFL